MSTLRDPGDWIILAKNAGAFCLYCSKDEESFWDWSPSGQPVWGTSLAVKGKNGAYSFICIACK